MPLKKERPRWINRKGEVQIVKHEINADCAREEKEQRRRETDRGEEKASMSKRESRGKRN